MGGWGVGEFNDGLLTPSPISWSVSPIFQPSPTHHPPPSSAAEWRATATEFRGPTFDRRGDNPLRTHPISGGVSRSGRSESPKTRGFTRGWFRLSRKCPRITIFAFLLPTNVGYIIPLNEDNVDGKKSYVDDYPSPILSSNIPLSLLPRSDVVTLVFASKRTLKQE